MSQYYNPLVQQCSRTITYPPMFPNLVADPHLAQSAAKLAQIKAAAFTMELEHLVRPHGPHSDLRPYVCVWDNRGTLEPENMFTHQRVVDLCGEALEKVLPSLLDEDEYEQLVKTHGKEIWRFLSELRRLIRKFCQVNFEMVIEDEYRRAVE